MAYIVMAYSVMAYIVVAYIVMAFDGVALGGLVSCRRVAHRERVHACTSVRAACPKACVSFFEACL